MPEITFRPLTAENLPLLHGWLNTPHVLRSYTKQPISLSEVSAKYSARLAPNHYIHCHISLFANTPFGYLQSYRLRDVQTFAELLDMQDGVTLDLFIGDAAYLRRGLGAQMLRGYIEDILPNLFQDEMAVYIVHAIENAAALACSRRAGFKDMHELMEDGAPSLLLARNF